MPLGCQVRSRVVRIWEFRCLWTLTNIARGSKIIPLYELHPVVKGSYPPILWGLGLQINSEPIILNKLAPVGPRRFLVCGSLGFRGLQPYRVQGFNPSTSLADPSSTWARLGRLGFPLPVPGAWDPIICRLICGSETLNPKTPSCKHVTTA